MPKPFMIGLEVEEVALGGVMRKLHAMPGVVAIHFDFDKKPPTDNGAHAKEPPRRRGRPPNNESNGSHESNVRPDSSETGMQALLRIVRGGKTKTLADMRDAFTAMGRAPSSVPSLLHTLQKEKKIFRVGHSLYSTRKSSKKAAASKA